MPQGLVAHYRALSSVVLAVRRYQLVDLKESSRPVRFVQSTGKSTCLMGFFPDGHVENKSHRFWESSCLACKVIMVCFYS